MVRAVAKGVEGSRKGTSDPRRCVGPIARDGGSFGGSFGGASFGFSVRFSFFGRMDDAN
jgi:hypothetical protein